MAHWTDRLALAFHRVRDAAGRFGRRKKIKATPFDEKNDELPFNASGVVQVGPRRFVFVDNHVPSALFELVLDGGVEAERIARRPLAGVSDRQLRDPEGLARVDLDGEIILIVASSLCVKGSSRSDGLVRARYAPHGDLHAESMTGFRAWLLGHVPSLAEVGGREPDAGGVNIEGLAWDPRAPALLFGLRWPAERGHVSVIRVPVDAGRASWTTSSLGPPATVRIRVPKSSVTQGIRDICYDEQTDGFIMLLGRSTSHGDVPFQLCTWDGRSEEVRLLDVAFHRSMKPEGVTSFVSGGENKILVVDDGGGYAVFDYPRADQ